MFRSLSPIEPSQVVRGQYDGYLDEAGVRAHSETETFIALRCEIDNWRWAGVPFYLRTGKRMAEGARIISIAFREPPKSMFPTGSGVGAHGPDHLTFDLADASRLSLSFYGKRPGPGMTLDKQSLQFSLHETGQSVRRAGSIRAADLRRDERRPHAVQHAQRASRACGSGRSRSSRTHLPSARTSRDHGARTRSTSSSHRMPGVSRSNVRGARRDEDASRVVRAGRSVGQVSRRDPASFFIAHDATATTRIAPIAAPRIPPQSNLSSSPMPNSSVKIR